MIRILEAMQNRMGEKAYRWTIIFCSLPIAVAISYGFALLHEPRSLWIWRDILGVLS